MLVCGSPAQIFELSALMGALEASKPSDGDSTTNINDSPPLVRPEQQNHGVMGYLLPFQSCSPKAQKQDCCRFSPSALGSDVTPVQNASTISVKSKPVLRAQARARCWRATVLLR